MQHNSTQLKSNSRRSQIIWLVAGLGAAVAICLACGLVGLVGFVVSRPDVTSGLVSPLLTDAPDPAEQTNLRALPPTATLAPGEAPVTLVSGTLTPTSTPTPRPIPSITPTPPGSTPMAVEAAEGWSFEGVRVQPGPGLRWLLVYGEAINESGQSQAVLGFQGTFYDAQDQPLTLDDYDENWPIETLPDGERMPFELAIYGPTAVDRVELQINSEPGTEALRTGLEITDLEGRENEENFCVAGQVRSPDPPLAEYAQVAAVLYDEDDRVINWGIGFEPANAFEGQKSVRMFACAEHYNNVVARYELRAWGL